MIKKAKTLTVTFFILLFILVIAFFYNFRGFFNDRSQDGKIYINSNMFNIFETIEKSFSSKAHITILNDLESLPEVNKPLGDKVEFPCDFLYDNNLYTCTIIGDKNGENFELINKEKGAESQKVKPALDIINANWNEVEKVLPKKHKNVELTYNKDSIMNNSVYYNDSIFYMDILNINDNDYLICLNGYKNNDHYFWSASIYSK